jgi:hypothetical protein
VTRPEFRLGRAVVGLAVVASGVLQLLIGPFVRLVPKPPAGGPAQPALAYLTGIVLVVVGLALLAQRSFLFRNSSVRSQASLAAAAS